MSRVAATFIVICTVLFNILYLDITIRLFSLNIPQNYSTIIQLSTSTTDTATNPNSTSFEYNTTDGFTSSSITLATSEETTTKASTTTTIPQTTVTTTTTPTSPTTRTTRTTTTTIPEPCPLILSEPKEIKNLLLLDDKATSSNYTNYTVQFVTPVDATTALLVFSFRSKTGFWYLDDVSLKSDGSGDELIRNGGFENGPLNILWKYCSPKDPAMSMVISQLFFHSGKQCFASRGYYDDNDYLSQNFTIQSNTLYTLELYTFCKGEPHLFNATISFK